ncbi:MAG: tetratricopeptide repeat protein [Deltaproteobacteria bacterium]|nr:tetratricopeptide repeat protein [Deltaproteobacteria bacterium]
MENIELQIINFTALSVEILDDVPTSTPYSYFSLWPCEINYLKTYSKRLPGFVLLFWLVFFALVPRFVHGQTSVVITADEQFRFAEAYFTTREYYRAISEYERFIHFFPQDPRVELTMYKVGLSYVKGERFKQAIDAFDSLIEKYRDTEFAVKSYFKAAECYVKLKQYDAAFVVLDRLLMITQDPDVKDELHYRRGWIYLEMDQWEKAEASFDSISPENKNAYRLQDLSEKINKKKFVKTKNPHAAGWLAVIPGAGHLYCERYRDAFIAFLLNGAMILAAYEAFDHENEALGGLITFFEIGLYSGNIYSAVSSAHKYNRKQKRDFFRYLKEHSTLEASVMRPDEGQAVALLYKITF